ncbi:MAG: flagellar motor protein MotB [Betaproteobacteria bacterium HGW-Betaproteobacteria-3]|jgi:outer membrane protein OmpA-like peptidoglycan-associated protein|nr:MAG: flagellar motor protein MotB [Betaproteobacteria bacterium HGW-Betaproteobacteria-3]
MKHHSPVFRALLTLAVLGLVALAGCAGPASRVVLLPQSKASAIDITVGNQTQVLDQAYQVASVSARGDIAVDTTTADQVQAQFPQLLLRQPAPEQRYLLYFEPGGSKLTAESEAQLTAVVAVAGTRPGGEIIVIGHTDRVGSLEANDTLSRQRAAAIRELLLARGFAAERVEAVGRGEREPLVATDDEVDEPRNRRAEIVVR